jgi:gliding motility-associated lipoprotein GldH
MIRRISKYSFVIILTSILLLLSCNSNVIFSDSKEMNKKTWKLADIASFKVQMTDTVNSNNVIFTLRTGSSYPFRNIYLFVTSPDGKSITDTLQFNVADERGNWLGKGFGDIHELNLTYKSNVYFPVKGTYIFNIQHGMRSEDLNGVYDIGLRVEKISK